MQSKIKKQNPIRVVSIGTGITQVKEVDPESITRFDWMTMSADFLIDIDVFAVNKILKMILSKQLKQQNEANNVTK